MEHTPTTNTAVLQQAFNHLNTANIPACLSLLTPDFTINIAEMPYPKHGHAAWRNHAEVLFAAFPDAKVTIDDIIAANDKVAVRVHIKGTHRGEFMGNRPTGKVVQYISHEVYRFEDGKIAEEWICSDSLTLLMQVGGISQTRLVSMYLSGYRFWFGLGMGAIVAAVVQGLFAKLV